MKVRLPKLKKSPKNATAGYHFSSTTQLIRNTRKNNRSRNCAVERFGCLCRRSWHRYHFWCFSCSQKKSIQIQVYAVEADGSAILSGEEPGPHRFRVFLLVLSQSTRHSSGIVRVTSDQAQWPWSVIIGGQEGFLVGISSAAAIYTAPKWQKLGTVKNSLLLR